MSPKGGNAHRFPSNGSAWRKLQYVSGNSGLTNKTFMTSPSLLLTDNQSTRKTVHYPFVICRGKMISRRAFHGAKLINASFFRCGPSLAHHPADILACVKSFPGC